MCRAPFNGLLDSTKKQAILTLHDVIFEKQAGHNDGRPPHNLFSFSMAGAMMSESHLMHKSADKRICERITFNRQMLVELEDGNTLECITKNISLGGVLLQSTQATDNCGLGQAVKLFIVRDSGLSGAYHCEVVRISDKFLSLKIDCNAAAQLGKELTKGVFVREQDNLFPRR